MFHVNFLDKVLDTLCLPALTIWSVSYLSLSCSNKHTSFLLFPFQILPSASSTEGVCGFFPYVVAGNKNELHDSKEESALHSCFITENVTECIFFLIFFSGDGIMQRKDIVKSKRSEIRSENLWTAPKWRQSEVFPSKLKQK